MHEPVLIVHKLCFRNIKFSPLLQNKNGREMIVNAYLVYIAPSRCPSCAGPAHCTDWGEMSGSVYNIWTLHTDCAVFLFIQLWITYVNGEGACERFHADLNLKNLPKTSHVDKSLNDLYFQQVNLSSASLRESLASLPLVEP